MKSLSLKNIQTRVQDESGITLLIALFLILVAGIVAAVILVTANSSLYAVYSDYDENTNQQVIDSALRDVRDNLTGTEVIRTASTSRVDGQMVTTYSYAPKSASASGMQQLVADALEAIQTTEGRYSEDSPYTRTLHINVSNSAFDQVDATFTMYPGNSNDSTAHNPYAIRIALSYTAGDTTYTEYLTAECEVEGNSQATAGDVSYRWGTPTATNKEA